MLFITSNFFYKLPPLHFFSVASYLKQLLAESGIVLDLGLVQTAYANGSSTEYITNKLVSQSSNSYCGRNLLIVKKPGQI